MEIGWDRLKANHILLAILIRLLISKHHIYCIKYGHLVFTVAHLLSPFLPTSVSLVCDDIGCPSLLV